MDIKQLRTHKVILFSLILMFFSSSCSEAQEQVVQNKAWNFTLAQAQIPQSPQAPQDSMKLSDFDGKVRLVNFWATWCPPCIMEIPVLNQLQKDFSADDFQIISISIDKRYRPNVPNFIKEKNIAYPVLYTDDLTVQKYGNFKNIPTTFLINRKGEFVDVFTGFVPIEILKEKVSAVINSKK
ncbi:MAG: TlpA family protein disulfide reductase [Fibrobacter sp.]|nr:TlpA family protein disulfide reductase [Fibrobacter sp.]